jgi:hypothetical protein
MRLVVYAAFCLLILSASPVMADNPKLLLADDFADLNSAWGKAADYKRVEGNALLIDLKKGQTLRNLYVGKKFADADIRIRLKVLKGGEAQWSGLSFWATDRDNQYQLVVRPDGKLQVIRRINGQMIFPVMSHGCKSFEAGLNKVNELRIVTSGSNATVFVNEVEALSLHGFPPAGGGQFGVYAEAGKEDSAWAFSNLRIYEGPVSAGRPPPDEKLLLADDFSRLDPSWGNADESRQVRENKLIMKAPRGKSAASVYEGALFGEVDIRVKITLAASERGGVEKSAGIVFWVDSVGGLEFFTVAIRPSGHVEILRKTKMNEWKAPFPKTPRSEIKKGVGQTNELRLVTGATSATIYINGKNIGNIDGFKPPQAYKIGLKVESDDDEAYTWGFSDFSVRKAE